jgi:hypothetical protein
MSSKRLVSVRASLFVAVLTLAAPAFFHGVSASAQGAAAKPVAAVAEEETAPVKDDASHQGIKVHGHWKIVVKNPDGSVVETREFENSLYAGLGNTFLANAVSGLLSPTGLYIYVAAPLVNGNRGTSPCAGTVGCNIVTSTTTGPAASVCAAAYSSNYTCAATLTTTVTSGTIVLAGQFVATQTASIAYVTTYSGTCASTVSGCPCHKHDSLHAGRYHWRPDRAGQRNDQLLLAL